MIYEKGDVHETAINQMAVESKLLQVPSRPPTMNQRANHNGTFKRPRQVLQVPGLGHAHKYVALLNRLVSAQPPPNLG